MDRILEFPLTRVVGGLIIPAGIWHLLAPSALHFSDVRPAVISSMAVGPAFIGCGAVLAAVSRLGRPIRACGVLAV
jgi:hypothetical protein